MDVNHGLNQPPQQESNLFELNGRIQGGRNRGKKGKAEGERGAGGRRERDQFVVLLIYALIGLLFFVL